MTESQFFDPVLVTQLEILLTNANIWKKLCDSPHKNNTEAFANLMTHGSSQLDSILFRYNCPYLYGLWAHPLFSPSRRFPNHPQYSENPLLHAMNENLLGRIFSYLDEIDLSHSVSLVCFLFRTSIVSRTHIHILLGKTLSSPNSTLVVPAVNIMPSVQQFTGRLKDLSHALRLAFGILSQFPHLDTLPVSFRLDRFLVDLFRLLPDCPERVLMLAAGLTSRVSLNHELTSIAALRTSIRLVLDPASEVHLALCTVLEACLTVGTCFGTQLLAHDAQGFAWTCLPQTHVIKSRFYEQCTLADVIITQVLKRSASAKSVGMEAWLALEKALDMILGNGEFPSVLSLVESARAVGHRVYSLSAAFPSHSSSSLFRARFFNLFGMLRRSCQTLFSELEHVNLELLRVTNWLFPAQSKEASVLSLLEPNHRELIDLRDFIKHVRHHMESAQEHVHIAMAFTSLETDAKEWKKNLESSSSSGENNSTVSKAFVSARTQVIMHGMHASFLRKRKLRMQQVSQEVINRTDFFDRQQHLLSALRLKTENPNVLEETTSPPTATSAFPVEEQERSPLLADLHKEASFLSTRLWRVHDTRQDEECWDHTEWILQGLDGVETLRAMLHKIRHEDAAVALESCLQANLLLVHQIHRALQEWIASGFDSAHLSYPLVQERFLAWQGQNGPLEQLMSFFLEPTREVSPLDVKSPKKEAVVVVNSRKCKLWSEWKAFPCQAGIWKSVVLTRFSLQEEEVFLHLFSHGVEVNQIVGHKHIKLRHFTSEDFDHASAKTQSRVDWERTIHGLNHSPKSLATRVVSKREEAHYDNNGIVWPVFSYARLLELKANKELTNVQLNPARLEEYLSGDEFFTVFRQSKSDFLLLPRWKQHHFKAKVGLF